MFQMLGAANGMPSVKILNENLGRQVAPCWSIVLCEVTFCAAIVGISTVVFLSLALDALASQSCIVCPTQLVGSEETLTMAQLTNVYNYDTPVAKLELCLSTFQTWFCYNGLALNPDKSEAITFGTTQRSRSLPITSTVNVAGTLVQVSNQVRILGVTFDSRLSFDAHISALSKSCFYYIRALHHIRLTSHWTAPRTWPVLSSAVASIKLTWLSCGSRLRTFLDFNVCKACSLVLSHGNGDASASPRLYRSFIGSLTSGA